MRYLSYAILGVLALISIVVGALWSSSYLSMDHTYTHRSETLKLPAFDRGVSDGLVRLDTKRGEFRARVAGFAAGEDRELVILLHGFPVTSAMWIDLIPVLANAGYRVIAFDQRGYSPQVRPEGVDGYQILEMTADVFAVADLAGSEKFHLVGHDWGAGVGWSAVLERPSRIASWTPMSIAHPAAFGAALQNDPEQQSKSSYFAFFVTPNIPEIFLSFNDFQMLRAVFGNMRTEKVEDYIKVFSEPGAISAGLNWYRAAFSSAGANRADPQAQNYDVSVPTFFIWGNQDEAVGRVGTELMSDYMKGPYSVLELDAGHWLLTEFPNKVSQNILSHIQGH
jgi:pimeloyl-ACP methyl ester carboxylesterase